MQSEIFKILSIEKPTVNVHYDLKQRAEQNQKQIIFYF